MQTFILFNPDNSDKFNQQIFEMASKDGATPIPAVVDDWTQRTGYFRKPIFEMYGFYTKENNGVKRPVKEDDEEFVVFMKLNLTAVFDRMGYDFTHENGNSIWAHNRFLFHKNDKLGNELHKWAVNQSDIGALVKKGDHWEPDLNLRDPENPENHIEATYAHLISDAIVVNLEEELQYNKNNGFYFYRADFEPDFNSAKIVFKGMGSPTPQFGKGIVSQGRSVLNWLDEFHSNNNG